MTILRAIALLAKKWPAMNIIYLPTSILSPTSPPIV
jgi:hypothetical protein